MSDRVCVVSGASAGIGEAVARSLVAEGARVVVNGRRAERLGALREELGGDRVAVSAGDASTDEAVSGMLDAAREAFGREADLVVVNAGRGLKGSLFDSDPGQWESMIRLNVLGAARLMRAAGERLVAMGPEPSEGEGWLSARARDIVVLGSTVGRHISPFSSMYGGTKFAVNSYAEALRRELAPRGVRVTLIEPAVVKSEFQDSAGYDPEGFGAFMERIGPVLSPADVARCVMFAVSQPAGVHVNDIVVRPTRQAYP